MLPSAGLAESDPQSFHYGALLAPTSHGRAGFRNQVLFNASHAARCTARHGVRSHAVPVALVGECPISLLWNVARRRWKALLRSQRGSYGRATSISRRISWSSSSFPARTIFHTGAKEPSPHGEFTQISREANGPSRSSPCGGSCHRPTSTTRSAGLSTP